MKKKTLLLGFILLLGTSVLGNSIGLTGDLNIDKRAEDFEVMEISWSVQPKLGITKGDYYKAEQRFRQGHLGELEVVKNRGKIVFVEFNELTRPNYYNRYYQNAQKRLSDYNFSMGHKAGATWINGAIAAEESILKNQSLTADVELVAGASNSIKQSMMVLAKEIDKDIKTPSKAKYYGIAEVLGGGLTGRVQVVVEEGKITSVRYDEIFADTPNEIENKNLKPLYRQSKYSSMTYDEPSRIGFNVQMDALNSKVVETQNLLDLTGLPATENTGNYGTSGYTTRNSAWDNYLKLAEKLVKEMKKDKVIK